MKKAFFSLAFFFALSSHASMGDFDARITCPENEAMQIVKDFAGSSKKETFNKSLITAGKALKSDLYELLTVKSHRSISNAADIQFKIKQAACVIEIVTPETYSFVMRGSYKDQLRFISLQLKHNANNSPLVPQTVPQKNSEVANALIGANRTTIAFIFGLF